MKINEAYTSKTCSSCGNKQEMPLHRRIYRCPLCGMKMDRDENSAINIWKRSLAVLPPEMLSLNCNDSIIAEELKQTSTIVRI